MREALTCYMTGAYRATIVLSYIALFDDIISKLDVLGKVNRKAKRIYDEVSKKRGDQEVFENDLINQLSSNNLLSSLDTTFLDILRRLINKAAHPSWHQPSAEEARFIYYEVISLFLSKEILSTTQLADEILASMGDKNLFPSRDIDVVAKVVRKELESIHSAAYSYLVSKLLDKIVSSDANVSKNANIFITGMAYNCSDVESIETIKKFLVEKKSQDEKYYITITSVITANPLIINGIDDIACKRLKVIIAEQIGSVDSTLPHSNFSHPVALFSSMFGMCEDKFIKDNFSDELDSLFKEYMYSSYLINKLNNSFYSKEKYIAALLDKAGSSDFNTANYFARHAYEIADDLDLILDERNSFKLILQVVSSGDGGSFGANDMRKARFSSIPKIRDKARAYDGNNSDEGKVIYREIFADDSNYDKNMNAYLR